MIFGRCVLMINRAECSLIQPDNDYSSLRCVRSRCFLFHLKNIQLLEIISCNNPLLTQRVTHDIVVNVTHVHGNSCFILMFGKMFFVVLPPPCQREGDNIQTPQQSPRNNHRLLANAIISFKKQ